MQSDPLSPQGRHTVTVWDQWHGDGLPYAMPADEAA